MSDRDDDDREHRDDANRNGDEKQQGDDPKDDDGDGEEEEDSGPPLYKKPIFWIILIVVAVISIVGGTLFWLHKRQYESTDDAFVDAHIVRIAAEVQGKLTHVADIDNRHVQAGTLLATIEPYASAASLDQAKAQAIQADAGIQQAQAQVVSAQAQQRQAEAQARDPEAQAMKAAADLQRYLALQKLDSAAVSGTQIDQAREAAKSSAAQAAAARRAVDNAAAQVAVAQKQVKANEAQKQAAEAQIRSAQVTVGHLDLRAPVSGQVVNRSVNLGSYVSPGTQLMAIVPDRMWVTANFKETQLAHMAIGQHVAISVDAFPEVAFDGHVDSIQRGAGQAFALLPPQNATGNYVKVVQRVPVRILFDRPRRDSPDPHNYPIGPGMSVVPTVKVR
ncbi:HlyD family secretion protein [Sphingomonas sp. CGMCC 1.13654]|uniref:HlyD family secretion protein n=1 Tax=Sphingomonas chungangi TaxID=2683589 RepID=A0A838LFQ0_9SPHN|nr:HlyD family secretion protein [Sphingomonas chungangi]MBA2936258.1 HlyD family secretion protein [Sphingomonas chungangi]MVW55643.1 HlyD family efflux transporter periplasmic adaptor subunit [Sphingomonas chungangi]